jgi:UPF0755 protein
VGRKRAGASARARRSSKGLASRRALARALIYGAAGLVGLALAALGGLSLVYPKTRGPGRGRVVEIALEPGLDIDRLAARLDDVGVIEHPALFAAYGRMLGADERLRVGAVLLTDDMSPRDVLARLASGLGGAAIRVTLPEGFTRFDVAARLERWEICSAREVLAATEDRTLLDELGIPGPSAEGYLFPDTYRLEQGLTGVEIVRRLVANWRRRAAPLYDEHHAQFEGLRRDLEWTPHETLVLASIVEKEAVVSEERPVIAGVFLNRLRMPGFSPRRLQADPTVGYGCRAAPLGASSCASFDGRRITRAMLADDANVYNTYRHDGLPPGPICNPGLSSLRAVLSADRHDYLYFVARGGGRHDFSATLDAHNAAVARLRERERRAAGAP